MTFKVYHKIGVCSDGSPIYSVRTLEARTIEEGLAALDAPDDLISPEVTTRPIADRVRPRPL